MSQGASEEQMRQREQVLVLQQEEVRRSDQCQCDPQEQWRLGRKRPPE